MTIQGEPYSTDEVLADGHLTITNPYGTVNYVCDIETGLTDDVVEDVVEYFANLGKRLLSEQRPLLITHRLFDLVVERLLEKNLEFIDVGGNIYLNSPEIYVLVRRYVPKNQTDKLLEITTEAWQVIYTLLKQPKFMLEDNYKWIAHVSGVTQKTVESTLEKLQDLKYIKPQ